MQRQQHVTILNTERCKLLDIGIARLLIDSPSLFFLLSSYSFQQTTQLTEVTAPILLLPFVFRSFRRFHANVHIYFALAAYSFFSIYVSKRRNRNVLRKHSYWHISSSSSFTVRQARPPGLHSLFNCLLSLVSLCLSLYICYSLSILYTHRIYIYIGYMPS